MSARRVFASALRRRVDYPFSSRGMGELARVVDILTLASEGFVTRLGDALEESLPDEQDDDDSPGFMLRITTR